MARKDAKLPEIPVEDAETPTGEVALEPGAEGADLASEATTATVEAAPEERDAEPGAEESAAPEAGAEEGAAAEDATAATESPEEAVEQGEEIGEGTEDEAEAAPVAPAVESAEAEAAEGEGGIVGLDGAEVRQVRQYRPTEDYAEGDCVYHPVWQAAGIVKFRDPQERIFRIPIGRVEERGRCRMITVEFDTDVPTAAGPSREVKLIADWHGRAFDVGVQPEPEPEPLVSFRPAEEERPARAKAPALPEIPDPDELDEDEDVEEEEEEPGEDEEGPLEL